MRRIAAVLLLALLLPVAVAAPGAVTTVEAVGLTVSDLDREVAFFTEVLGFEKLSEVEVFGEGYERLENLFGLRMRVARLRLGDEILELTAFLAPAGRPIPVDSRSNDRWFQHVAIVVRDMAAAYAHLRAHGVRHASSGPQRLPDWNVNAGGIEAFYFKDPEDHVLEVIFFPAGKGDPRWQRPGEDLFLGIDHTAIVVADTETSLGFYRDALGLRVAGGAENWGTEQEHLNNVFGARLRITTLVAGSGPGIELLEYLAPRDGRSYPADTRASDLWNWRTTLAAPAVPDAVELPEGTLGFRRGRTVRDPDGHALRFVERAPARGEDTR